MSALTDKAIVVGVSGGIAAYKAAELVRLLTAAGARVRVMMTRNAQEFITPLTLQTLSMNPVATETFSLTQESEIGHIRLADTADAIVVAHRAGMLLLHQAQQRRRQVIVSVWAWTTVPRSVQSRTKCFLTSIEATIPAQRC